MMSTKLSLLPEVIRGIKRSGILIREGGQTVEITEAKWREIFPDAMTEQVTAATDGDILALRNELDTVSAGEILSLVARIDADRAKIAAMRDGMKGAVRIKPLVWEEDLADPRLLGEGCCYYVADGTLWFFDPSIHRIKAKLGVQVHLEGRTISDAAQADYEARLIASGVVEPVEVPR